MGWTTGVRFPAGAVSFSPHHLDQTGSGVHTISHLMGTGGKEAGEWSWPLTFI